MRHAEVVALDDLRHSTLCAEAGGLEALLAQCEPCIMCSAALVLVHIGTVYFG